MAGKKPQAVTKASYRLALAKLQARHRPDDDELPESAAKMHA